MRATRRSGPVILRDSRGPRTGTSLAGDRAMPRSVYALGAIAAVALGLSGCTDAPDEGADTTAQDLATAPQHIAGGIERTHQVAGASLVDSAARVGSLRQRALARSIFLPRVHRGGRHPLAAPRVAARCEGRADLPQHVHRLVRVLRRGEGLRGADVPRDRAALGGLAGRPHTVKIPWAGAGLVHAGFHQRFISLWNADANAACPKGWSRF